MDGDQQRHLHPRQQRRLQLGGCRQRNGHLHLHRSVDQPRLCDVVAGRSGRHPDRRRQRGDGGHLQRQQRRQPFHFRQSQRRAAHRHHSRARHAPSQLHRQHYRTRLHRRVGRHRHAVGPCGAGQSARVAQRQLRYNHGHRRQRRHVHAGQQHQRCDRVVPLHRRLDQFHRPCRLPAASPHHLHRRGRAWSLQLVRGRQRTARHLVQQSRPRSAHHAGAPLQRRIPRRRLRDAGLRAVLRAAGADRVYALRRISSGHHLQRLLLPTTSAKLV